MNNISRIDDHSYAIQIKGLNKKIIIHCDDKINAKDCFAAIRDAFSHYSIENGPSLGQKKIYVDGSKIRYSLTPVNITSKLESKIPSLLGGSKTNTIELHLHKEAFLAEQVKQIVAKELPESTTPEFDSFLIKNDPHLGFPPDLMGSIGVIVDENAENFTHKVIGAGEKFSELLFNQNYLKSFATSNSMMHAFIVTNNDYKEEIMQYEKQIEDDKKKINQKQEEVEKCNMEMNQYKSKGQGAAVEKCSAEINELQQSIRKCQNRIDELNQKINNCKNRLDIVEATLSGLHRDTFELGKENVSNILIYRPRDKETRAYLASYAQLMAGNKAEDPKLINPYGRVDAALATVKKNFSDINIEEKKMLAAVIADILSGDKIQEPSGRLKNFFCSSFVLTAMQSSFIIRHLEEQLLLKIRSMGKEQIKEEIFESMTSKESSLYKIMKENYLFKLHPDATTPASLGHLFINRTAAASNYNHDAVEKFNSKYLESLQKLKAGVVFSGYAKNEKGKNLPTEIQKLTKEKKALEKKLQSEERLISELIVKKNNDPANTTLTKDIELKINQHTKTNELLINTSNNIDRLNESLNKFNSLQQKARITRELFTQVGGESVQLTTKDDVRLDGTFLNANSFRKKIIDCNGQLITIRHEGEKCVKQIQGISFKSSDLIKNEKHIINTLDNLTALTNISETKMTLGSGWTKVQDGDNVILIKNEEIADLINNKLNKDSIIIPLAEGTLTLNPELKVERTYKKIPSTSSGGTVIVTSGIEGVYEQHKVEALAFLFQGMNVLLFNFRGYGQSQGIPSEQGFYNDIEAAYQYCKEKTNQPDEKILLKAICMSGGVAAHLAALHPEVNIFLDQTYSSFRQLVEEQISDCIKSTAHEMRMQIEQGEALDLEEKLTLWAAENFSTIAAKAAKLLVPNFNVADNLAKNMGQKALLFVHDDEVISSSHVEQIVQTIEKEQQMSTFSLFSAPGTHGTYWPHVFTQAYQFLAQGKEIKAIEKSTEDAKAELQKALDKITLPETEQNQQKIADLKRELSLLEAAMKAKKEAILASIEEPEQKMGAYTGLAIVNHFLNKTKLSDSLIKTSIELKRETDPQMKLITTNSSSIIKQINDFENILKEFNNISQCKTNIKLEVDKKYHTFTLPTGMQEKISNEDIQTLKFFNKTNNILILLDELKQFGIFDKDLENKIKQLTNESNSLGDLIDECYEFNNQKLIETVKDKIFNISSDVSSIASKTKLVEEELEKTLVFGMILDSTKTEEILQILKCTQQQNELLGEERNKINALEVDFMQQVQTHPNISEKKIDVSVRIDQAGLHTHKQIQQVKIYTEMFIVFQQIHALCVKSDDNLNKLNLIEQQIVDLKNKVKDLTEKDAEKDIKTLNPILAELDQLGEKLESLMESDRKLQNEYKMNINKFELANDQEKLLSFKFNSIESGIKQSKLLFNDVNALIIDLL